MVLCEISSINVDDMSIDISISCIFRDDIYYMVRCSWRGQSIINPAVFEDCVQKVGEDIGAIETRDHGQS